MFVDDPGDQRVRGTVHGWTAWRVRPGEVRGEVYREGQGPGGAVEVNEGEISVDGNENRSSRANPPFMTTQ